MSLNAVDRMITLLERRMRQAAGAEDFETAARLRDEIAELRGGGPALVRKPPPGQMGLGTHIPVVAPPEGWKKPAKPAPMTKSTRGRRPPGKR